MPSACLAFLPASLSHVLSRLLLPGSPITEQCFAINVLPACNQCVFVCLGVEAGEVRMGAGTLVS